MGRLRNQQHELVAQALADGMSGCGNIEGVILGLKRDLKTTRERVRELKDQNMHWCSVAQTLRKLAGLDEEKFKNLLKAESLPCE
jgi:hypothetical protein